MYTKSNEAKREINYKPIVCPNCFAVIYERNGNRCPECDFIIQEQQEKREREILETQRAEKVIEIQSEYDAVNVIAKLNQLFNGSGNTFYYTKLLPLKPANIDIETFNNEVTRLTNYCKKCGYKPYYIV